MPTKTGRSRQPTPAAPTGLVLSQVGADINIAWATPSGTETIQARLLNAITGWIEDQTDDASAGGITFLHTPTSGQDYFARVRVLVNGEPGPVVTSNTLNWP